MGVSVNGKPTVSKTVTWGSTPHTPAMLIEVNTGTMAMVGYQSSFKVECREKSCKKCALRFRCYTSREEKIDIDMDDWFKVNKVIKHKILYEEISCKVL